MTSDAIYGSNIKFSLPTEWPKCNNVRTLGPICYACNLTKQLTHCMCDEGTSNVTQQSHDLWSPMVQFSRHLSLSLISAACRCMQSPQRNPNTVRHRDLAAGPLYIASSARSGTERTRPGGPELHWSGCWIQCKQRTTAWRQCSCVVRRRRSVQSTWKTSCNEKQRHMACNTLNALALFTCSSWQTGQCE